MFDFMKLQKQLEVTAEVLAQIEAVTNTTVEAGAIAVFEAVALSTAPINQLGSIFHGARSDRQMLVDMALALNSGAENVPLHTLHQQRSELPVGKVFHARVQDEVDGTTTLRAMFYLPRTAADLISKIDLSILDEVSVGVKSKQAFCSKCGFDFFAEDTSSEFLWSQTCPSDHTIGENGVHLRLSGLDRWMELSLVSRGASSKPKILSRPRELLPPAEYERLAASGKPVEALFLFNSTPLETPDMADTETLAALVALTASVQALQAPDPKIAELEAQILALQIPDPKIAELEADKATLQAQIDTLKPKLPVGGLAASAITDAKTLGAPSMASAFKTKPRS